LLDRGLSDLDIEPKDSDFFCHEATSQLEIVIKFEKVTDDCVVSKLPGKISDDGVLYLAYRAWKDSHEYKFYAGHSIEALEEIQERFYRKVLHLKYISSNRDLNSYVRKEKRNLLKEAKEKRTDEEIKQDDLSLDIIEKDLLKTNKDVSNLKYVKSATEVINAELKELSIHHSDQNIIFDVGASDLNSFVENLHLSSQVGNSNLIIGGDGRNNQIFLALWAARNEIQDVNPLEVVFYCIEEPEAHLHPHQQRKLAQYLIEKLKGQVFITSHSPQIAAEFSPNSIVRLFQDAKKGARAASEGCSNIIQKSFLDFGYRLNVVAAEAFFASAVFLVEGISEVIFFKALAKQLDIDLDKLNISILMADGVGFETFSKILTALNIEWFVRTDNDVFKIPKKPEFRMAGVQRALSMFEEKFDLTEDDKEVISRNRGLLTGFLTEIPPEENLKAAKSIIDILKSEHIYLAGKDLETDLMDQGLEASLIDFFDVDSRKDALTLMQKKKATHMFNFIQKKHESLKVLTDSEIANQLRACCILPTN
jgi:putative ATP-dependent endonuclease of OLD family